RVAGGGPGTLAAIPETQLMPVPDRLSIVEAGAIPEAGLTAWTNLVAEGGLQAGESVLVTGASGGMGSFAVQLARELGSRVIATARGREGLERLRELGIDALVPAGPDLPERVLEANGGRGVDLVFDLVGGAQLPLHLKTLAERGRLVLVGLLAGGSVPLELGLLLVRRLRLIGSVLRYRSRAEKAELIRAFSDFALPRLADGRLRPVVGKVVPFADVAQAYADLAAGSANGKIVLQMGG
ncbi:MAG TPA: zinc-binding dehydrogenase, partial [Thermoanaerobaculia bacterium]